MKSELGLLAFASASQAIVTRGDNCSFHLTASGGPGGEVGQLSDGQNRIGDKSLPAGSYSFGANGTLIDSKGRECLLTPPTGQWQCDAGGNPTPGHSLGCDGTLLYQGSSKFYTCPTGQNDGWNIYSEPISGEPSCTPVTLKADSCYSGCVTTSTTTAPCPTSTSAACTTSTPATPPPPKSTCPGELSGSWEFPHLIIPIDTAHPNKAFGTSYNGTAGGSVSSIFNFDIPASYANKTCTLEFLFPTQSQLETSAYSVSGTNASFAFYYLSGVATKDTTYANAPKPEYNFGNFVLAPGSATTIGGSTPGGSGCPAGTTVSFLMGAIGRSSIDYFQDSNPCPIGLYLTAH